MKNKKKVYLNQYKKTSKMEVKKFQEKPYLNEKKKSLWK